MSTGIDLRIGIPEVNGRFIHEAKDHNYKIMISVSRFWKWPKKRFQKPGKGLNGLDIFLDSAGFTAQSKWGGYPWTPDMYLDQVALGTWTYWSQMDFCCEPEVANDQTEVLRRVSETAKYLDVLLRGAAEREMTAPTPVLQGWTPSNYALSAQLADDVLGGTWPDLVGVGSVCRRNVNGADGIVSIVEALDKILPPNVKLHLFGVKSQALRVLREHPRVTSSDSMAWDFAVRMECRKASRSFDIASRVAGMHKWKRRQDTYLR
tara:strand:- start:379 stop:1167 length:789 start_codon:yes stop_codon:yes gene_type:complete